MKSSTRAALVVAALTAFLVLASAELWLRAFPETDSVGVTLPAQAWMRQCWKLGADGYRGQPAPQGGPAVVVVGDSFAAGYGVCDPRERFGNQLAAQLGPRASVYVIAENGADTRREWTMLQAFPQRPAVLVLSYLGNDIDGVAKSHGLRPRALPAPRPAVQAMIDRSFLASVVYWRNLDVAAYRDYYHQAWGDPGVVHEHLRDVDRFLSLGVPTIVVLWPASIFDGAYERLIEDRAAGAGAVVLRVRDLTGGIPAHRLIVNAHDMHPSAEVHRLVGAALAPLVLSSRTFASMRDRQR